MNNSLSVKMHGLVFGGNMVCRVDDVDLGRWVVGVGRAGDGFLRLEHDGEVLSRVLPESLVSCCK